MEDAPEPFDASYPRHLAAIVSRALAKERSARYPTALAMQDELSAFATQMRLDVSQFGMMRLMSQLFVGELMAWHAAQKSGQSLVDHVIKRSSMTIEAIEPPPTAATIPERRMPERATLEPPPRRRSHAWIFALAILVGGAIGAIAWRVATQPSASPLARDAAPIAADAASIAADAAPAPVVAIPPHDAGAIDAVPDAAVVPPDAAGVRKRPHTPKRLDQPPRLEDGSDPDNIIR
jgi:hypothetical protein